MTAQPACEWRQVWVYYGTSAALRGASLRAERGQIVGIFGHNGAGKSTLLRALLGLVQTYRGQVLVEGEPLSRQNLAKVRLQIGYVPQMLQRDREVPLSAWDVVMTAHWAKLGWGRFAKVEHRQATAEALAKMGILHLANKPFSHLSGGEQQRVLLARALVCSPRILLLDEPTNSVDWHLTRQLAIHIRQTHELYQLTTVVVSHDALFLSLLCDRIALMEQGTIREVLPASQLLTYLEKQEIR